MGILQELKATMSSTITLHRKVFKDTEEVTSTEHVEMMASGILPRNAAIQKLHLVFDYFSYLKHQITSLKHWNK